MALGHLGQRCPSPSKLGKVRSPRNFVECHGTANVLCTFQHWVQASVCVIRLMTHKRRNEGLSVVVVRERATASEPTGVFDQCAVWASVLRSQGLALPISPRSPEVPSSGEQSCLWLDWACSTGRPRAWRGQAMTPVTAAA